MCWGSVMSSWREGSAWSLSVLCCVLGWSYYRWWAGYLIRGLRGLFFCERLAFFFLGLFLFLFFFLFIKFAVNHLAQLDGWHSLRLEKHCYCEAARQTVGTLWYLNILGSSLELVVFQVNWLHGRLVPGSLHCGGLFQGNLAEWSFLLFLLFLGNLSGRLLLRKLEFRLSFRLRGGRGNLLLLTLFGHLEWFGLRLGFWLCLFLFLFVFILCMVNEVCLEDNIQPAPFIWCGVWENMFYCCSCCRKLCSDRKERREKYIGENKNRNYRKISKVCNVFVFHR